MKVVIPQSVKACLWSYDTDMIGLSVVAHRTRIIQNILNRGTSDAVAWLRETFSEEEIMKAITKSSSSDWSKKSLSLWSLIFNVRPARERRFV